jgi:hypothetical protein
VVVRRWSILVLALAIMLVAYAPLFFVMLRRTMYVFFPPMGIRGPKRSGPPADLFGLPDMPTVVHEWGIPVHVSVVLALALTIPALLIANDIACWRRRRRRERLGQCVDCGHPLKTWRGRCPGCGVRIGPG